MSKIAFLASYKVNLTLSLTKSVSRTIIHVTCRPKHFSQFSKTQSKSINDVCFLLKVMTVNNDAEMVTLLVINGKEVKQGWVVQFPTIQESKISSI